MYDEQIVEALECCKSRNCVECPRLFNDLPDTPECQVDLMKKVYSLINRQKATIDELTKTYKNLKSEKNAEIERLKRQNERLEYAFVAECELSACPRKEEIRGEAIKDALNIAKKRIGDLDLHFQNYAYAIMAIMDIEKEMVGDNDV